MLIGFFDDTEVVVDEEDPAPDFFVFGGYFIQQAQLQSFQRRIIEVKRTYGLNPNAPIKWNLRDTSLLAFYNSSNFLSAIEPDRLLQISHPIRHDLLALLNEFNATVFVSARYDRSAREATTKEFYGWAFENLLQRAGLFAERLNTRSQDDQSVMLVIDWPSKLIGKGLFDIYQGGFHYGYGLSTRQSYYSGPLSKHRFLESLTHSSTLHCGSLQIADLVVGCCRGFLRWAYTGKGIGRINGFFDLLIDRFDTDQNGHINNCGFKVAKANQLDIQAKIIEFQLRTIELEDDDKEDDDIPF